MGERVREDSATFISVTIRAGTSIIVVKKKGRTLKQNCRITCWVVLNVAGNVDLMLTDRKAEKPNSRQKIFRPIRVIICQ